VGAVFVGSLAGGRYILTSRNNVKVVMVRERIQELEQACICIPILHVTRDVQ
jgi:hypothetical protein